MKKISYLAFCLLFFACNTNNKSFAPDAHPIASDMKDVLWYEAIQPVASNKKGLLIIQTDQRTDSLFMDANQLNAALTVLSTPYVKYDVRNYNLYGSKTPKTF